MIHALQAALMAPQLTSSYFQAEDAEDQVRFHNDHQIPFPLEEGGGRDETESPCIALPPYLLPSELRLGPLCGVQQKVDSNKRTRKKRLSMHLCC